MTKKQTKTTRRTDGISYRNHDGAWYSSASGKYLPLRDESGQKIKGENNETAAKIAYGRLLEGLQTGEVAPVEIVKPENKAATIGQVADAYLQHTRAAGGKYDVMRRVLRHFCCWLGMSRAERQAAIEAGSGYERNNEDYERGKMTPAAKVERGDVLEWQTAHSQVWAGNTAAYYTQIVVTAFNYVVTNYGKRYGLTANPIAGVKRPATTSRVTYITHEQERAILAYRDGRGNSDPAWADLFSFLLLTGCRPGEAKAITADHIRRTPHGLQIVLKAARQGRQSEHKAGKKTGKDRVIYCSPEAAAIVERRAMKWQSGPIFRTRQGRPWNPGLLRKKWDYIKAYCEAKHGADFLTCEGAPLVIYSTRHTFATRRLTEGFSMAVVAGLLGNTVGVCERHYSHLDVANNALWAAVAPAKSMAG